MKAPNNQRGTYYECRVATELLRRGCDVFMPFGGYAQIDLVVTADSGLIARLQVKAAGSKGQGKYTIQTMRQNKRLGPMYAYTAIDFFVACTEEDVWIFPAGECVKRRKTCYPNSTNKNAWHLISGFVRAQIPASQNVHTVTQERLYAV